MNGSHLDHVNLKIPESRVDACVWFYRDVLGLELEDLAEYRDGKRPLFSVRISEHSVIHVAPSEEFDESSARNYDHFAIVFNESVETVKQNLLDADIEILRESSPKGATGRAPAVYVRDPFGYRIELKSVIE